ncbi:MAG: serine/threonine protein kinase [Timaviella obliquedivisa GSE-PSE-MK23-08B]|nr:serine/threonine protein kinase [Timaviella obliquedivisa GSE-PSE-MK23-08B]
MSYCINPKCLHRQNPDLLEFCQSCGTALLIQNRYRLIHPLRELDEHSYSEVFEVDDQGIIRVLKIIRSPNLVQLFEREVRTLQHLQHPGIPHVEPDGYFTVALSNDSRKTLKLHCLVMEKIDGQNLEQWLAQQKPISQDLAVDWLKQLLEILNLLHQNKLFHRDIKLSNIMLQPNGQLVLIDFGSVRQITNTYLAKVGGGRDITGIVSPGYTSLEQANGKAVPQSDFYALGRSLVHLMTGKHPIDFLESAKTGTLKWRDSAPGISSWFANLINDLMSPFPGNRPLNAQEILERLQKDRYLLSNNLLLCFNIGLSILLIFTCLSARKNWAEWQEMQNQCSKSVSSVNLSDQNIPLIICPK